MDVTLGDAFASRTHLSPTWWDDLHCLWSNVKIYLRVCWLRTISGAWTTTHRMGEERVWQCMFGCPNEDDNLLHYLVCPILWQIACGVFKGEESLSVSERLCLQSPSVVKLQRLSVCHSVYHACKNHPACTVNGFPASALIVQNRGYEFSRAMKHLAL